MKKLLIILIILCPAAVWSQSLTITAKVRDRETAENLGFASVGVKGRPIGTISNGEGEFDFRFPLEMRNDTLVISMMGYQNFEAPISTLLDQVDLVILLDKSPIVLEEIVVSDTLTGGDILRIALSRIEQNYPMQPFLLDGFYRDVKKVGGRYISLLEAAVQIYDENYAPPRNQEKLRESVRLVHVRKSLGYESKFTTYFDQTNLLEDLLLENTVRYRHIEADDAFFSVFTRERNSVFDGKDLYVVYMNEESKLKVYIDTQDFSLVHLEYETGFLGEIKRKKDLVSKFVGSKKSIGFRKYDGRMYPSYMSMNTRINWYDVKSGELKFETELIQQLLINNVDPNSKQRINSTERMRNYSLQYQDLGYNKEFWDNYNFIKETPLDKQILSDLEKDGPLEKQFADY